MNLIFLYDEFMRVPLGMEGNPVYIFDNTLSEGYELSEKIIENRYFLAKEAGAEIYQGNTYEILQEIHSQNPISKITTKATFRPVYQEKLQEEKKQGLDPFDKDLKGETSLMEPCFIVALREIMQKASTKEIKITSKRH